MTASSATATTDVVSPAAVRGVFRQLNAEWDVLCAQPAVIAQVRTWLQAEGLVDEGEPAGPRTVVERLGSRDQPAARADADRWLTALLRRATSNGAGAQLAARIVVQAMMPSVVRIQRSQLRAHGGRSFDEVAQVVISALFQVVRSYPLQERPERVAANLTLDTLALARRELLAEQPPAEIPVDVIELPHPTPGADPGRQAELVMLMARAAQHGLEPEPAPGAAAAAVCGGARAELVELLLWALDEQVLDSGEVWSIAAHYRTDALPDLEAAHVAGISAAAVRKRRSRAVRKLTAAVHQLVA